MTGDPVLMAALPALAGLIVVRMLLLRTSRQLFRAVVDADPAQVAALADLSDCKWWAEEEPLPGVQVKYIWERRFDAVVDARARRLGLRARRLLVAYFSMFFVLLANVLWWVVTRHA